MKNVINKMAKVLLIGFSIVCIGLLLEYGGTFDVNNPKHYVFTGNAIEKRFFLELTAQYGIAIYAIICAVVGFSIKTK